MKKFLYFLMRLALLGCIAFAACGAVFAASFTVNTPDDTQDVSPGDGICTDSNGRCSLRAAISEANSLSGDDVITLPAGAYTTLLTGSHENANASGDFDINSNITINGAGSGDTFIQAAGTAGTATERPLQVSAASIATIVVINNVTLRYGRYVVDGFGGAGFQVEGTDANVTLNNVVIRDNQGFALGAGIYATGSPTLTLNNCLVANNNVNLITGNSPVAGGGIYSIGNGTVNVNNSTITNNNLNSTISSTFGAGIQLIDGTVNLINSTLGNNSVTASGGNNGICGGVFNLRGTLNITNSNITHNIAFMDAGVLTINGNTTINNSTIANNSAKYMGGGIVNNTGSVGSTTTINNSAIVNNSALDEGGGIINTGANGANAVLNVNNSTISGNTTDGYGGGIENFTIRGGNVVANINFSTIAGNSAGYGGGIANFRYITEGEIGTRIVNLKNSVVANNYADTGPDIWGIITSQSYNLVENTSGGTFVNTTGDETGIDPSLGALGLNGGTTLNYLPNPDSPLIDRIPNGVNGCGGFDQRGVSRPTDSDNNGVAACEKGSTERASAPTAASVSVTGRVLSSSGRGIANAVVAMTDPGGNTRFARTSTFGYYRFDDVQVSGTYIFTVSGKRYEFAATVRTITEETNNLNFVAP
ncbi:MAG TPA: carboxypeptidase regulatory-like domain-containing protein [Pyrinomonadaceae bacterium]|jgi:CSLREA domain-containing protein